MVERDVVGYEVGIWSFWDSRGGNRSREIDAERSTVDSVEVAEP